MKDLLDRQERRDVSPHALDNPGPGRSEKIVLPEHVSPREALFVLTALARVKKSRFGRLVISVSDGRVMEIELVEKVERNILKGF